MLRGRSSSSSSSSPNAESAELRSSSVRLLRLIIFAYALLLLPFSLVNRKGGGNLRSTATGDLSLASPSPPPPPPPPPDDLVAASSGAASSSTSSSYSSGGEAFGTGGSSTEAAEQAVDQAVDQSVDQTAAADKGNKSSAAAFSVLMVPSCVLLCLAFSAIRRMRRLEQFLSDHRHGHSPLRSPLLFGFGGPAMGSTPGLVELLSRDPRNARLAARLRLLMADRDFDGDDYSELLHLDDDNNGGNSSHRKATPSEIRRLPTLVLNEAEVERMRRQSREDAASAGGAMAEEEQAMDKEAMDEEAGGMSGGWSKRERAVCAVCLAPWAVGDEVRTLPCLHRLHTECIDPWLKQNATCPVCKYSAVG